MEAMGIKGGQKRWEGGGCGSKISQKILASVR